MSTEAWIVGPETRLRRDALEMLKTWDLLSVEGANRFSLGEVKQRLPEKSIVRFEYEQRVYFLKRYHYNRLWVFVRAAFKWNFPVFSGIAEWEAIQTLRHHGFRVPRAVAMGQGGTLFHGLSFILMEQIGGASLDLKIPEMSAAEIQRCAYRVGQLLGHFHELGFVHKDMYLCHIFDHEQDGLGLIDCERVEHFEEGLPRRWRVKDLAALHYSSQEFPQCQHAWKRFLCGYFEHAKELRRDHTLLPSVVKKAETMARQGRKG